METPPKNVFNVTAVNAMWVEQKNCNYFKFFKLKCLKNIHYKKKYERILLLKSFLIMIMINNNI